MFKNPTDANAMDTLINVFRHLDQMPEIDVWLANVNITQQVPIVKSVCLSTMTNLGDGQPQRTLMHVDVSELCLSVSLCARTRFHSFSIQHFPISLKQIQLA